MKSADPNQWGGLDAPVPEAGVPGERAGPVPGDCQRCGVCCFSKSAEYVWVTGYDWEQLGADADRLAHFIANRAFMRMSDGHCGALEIRTLADGTAYFCCTIYDRRPEICRVLGRGSLECLGELATKADRVAAWTAIRR